MKKLRIYLSLTTRFIQKRLKWIIIFLLILSILGTVGYRIYSSAQKKVINEALVGTYREQDLPETVTNLLSTGLVKINKQGLPENNLITSMDISEDGKVYTLKLKDNLKWSDGSSIKSEDIQLTIPDAKISYPDEKTLQFTIDDSFSPFPTFLAKPILKKGTLIGLGPYSVLQVKKDRNFVKKLTLVSPNIEDPEVIIRFYDTEKTAKNALKLGESQVLLGVSETDDIVMNQSTGVWTFPNFNQVTTIFYNTKDPILSDTNLRLGLSFAAPSILGETEAKTSIPPDSWAYNDEVKDYLDNPVQAKNYLDRVKNGKDSQIALTTTNNLKDVGQKVVDAWKEAGLNAVLRVESGIPQNFQALLINQAIPKDPDQYSLWHSTQSQTNISQIAQPRIDKDLEDGRKSLDMEIRIARYQDFQKTLLDFAPATFLYFPKYQVVYIKNIPVETEKIINMQLGR